jgi:hypothetical protein
MANKRVSDEKFQENMTSDKFCLEGNISYWPTGLQKG